MCNINNSSFNQLIGKNFEYAKGSTETSFDAYKGLLMIIDIDYGNVRHSYISPQKGFDKNVQHETVRKIQSPYTFLDEWIKNQDNTVFLKGTPYVDKGKTWVDYIAYNKNSTQFVQMKTVRTPLR